MSNRSVSLLTETVHRLRDLAAPRDCGGCRAATAPGRALCPHCHHTLTTATPLAATGTLGGPVAAAGEYAGPLRGCLLAYKERGRRDLTAVLTALLLRVLTTVNPARAPLWLVPIPTTRRAFRHRGFDHVALLGRHLTAHLPETRLARVLSSRPRPDSTELDRAARIAAAAGALRCRRLAATALAARPDAEVLLLDDIVTTGATLAAARRALRNRGVSVAGAVTVAATSPHFPRKTGSRADDIPASSG